MLGIKPITMALFELHEGVFKPNQLFPVLYETNYDKEFTFACMHLTDAFIQSDLH